jgi:putative PEP-CTERM system histidine kinase
MGTLAVVVGFLGCALVFGALAVALRPSRFGRGAPRLRLRLACIATMLWALAALGAALQGSVTGSFVLASGVLLLAIWTWQLEVLAHAMGRSGWLCRVLNLAGPVIAAASLAALALMPDSPWTARWLPIAGLALATLGLVALEQILRAAGDAARAALRWMALGQGGVMVVLLLVFAESLMFSAVPVEPWVASGYALALAGLALRRGAMLMPDWSLGVSLSRAAAFYTTSLVLIGGYLLLLSVAGWWLASSALGWGRLPQVAFSLLGIATLAVLVFSEPLRRRIKVAIDKHFYPQRYDYRHEWLRLSRSLARPVEGSELPVVAIESLAQIVGSQGGALWRIDEAEGTCAQIAAWGVAGAAPAPVPATHRLVDFLNRTGWLIDLRELREQPQLYAGLASADVEPLGAADGFIVPLLYRDRLYGWITLQRSEQVRSLTFEDRDLLKTAARQITVHVVQFESDRRLAESSQFEAYHRMTAFVMHDLKNIAAQLRLISQNAERHRRNPEFVDDALRTVAASSTRMSKLIAQLAASAESGVVSVGTMQTVDLASLAERAALACSAGRPVPRVESEGRPFVFAESERLVAVIEHALRNAQDATPDDGEVLVEVGIEGERPYLRVSDTGCGMDDSFVRERLFKPFDTTKGTKGMGIGAFQIREYVRGLGGSVEVESTVGRGTRMTLLFPPRVDEAIMRRAG